MTADVLFHMQALNQVCVQVNSLHVIYSQHWGPTVSVLMYLAGIVDMTMCTAEGAAIPEAAIHPSTPSTALAGAQDSERQLPGEQVCTASHEMATCAVCHTTSTTPVRQHVSDWTWQRAAAAKLILNRYSGMGSGWKGNSLCYKSYICRIVSFNMAQYMVSCNSTRLHPPL